MNRFYFYLIFLMLMILFLGFSSCSLVEGIVENMDSLLKEDVPPDEPEEIDYDPSFSWQSRAPQGENHWLHNAGSTAGDPDQVGVYFFAVPADFPHDLYFTIHDPWTDTVEPDYESGGTWQSTFYLIGGEGCFSNSMSRKLYYEGADLAANGHLTGKKIYKRTFGVSTDSYWWYFPKVKADQGELVNDYYYFKIVVQGNNLDSDAQNAFQLNISQHYGGDPVGASGVRVFAYSWTLSLLNDDSGSDPWNFYPFISYNSNGNAKYYNWDFDAYESMTLYDGDDVYIQTLTSSGNGGTYPVGQTYADIPFGASYNCHWRIEINESNESTFINTGELWVLNGLNDSPYAIYNYDF